LENEKFEPSEGGTASPTRRNRFNYFACFFDAVGFPLGISLFSPVTILPLFVRKLTDETIWIGLIAAISGSGFFLPQLIAASWIQRMPIKRGYVLRLALIERFAILVLVPLSLLLGTNAPRALLISFFIVFAVHTFCMGFNGPAYFDMVAKLIPPTQRGSMYGIAGGVGGLFSIIGAWMAKYFLQRYDFPVNFSLCFLAGFVVLTVTVLPIGFIDEPPSRVQARTSWFKYFRDVGQIFKTHPNFKRYVYSQIFVSAFEAILAFFTAYALDEMGATEANVAEFTAVLMAGQMIGEPFWGHQADRRGNRLVLLINIGLACAVTSIAIITPSVGLFYAVFAVASFSRSGINIPGFNITMEFASPESLPTYVALRSSIIAPFRAVVPLIVGAIVGRVGYRSVFGGVAFLLLMGWVTMWRVREPRHEADKARKEELGRV